jgi:hypothetical protein
MRLLSARRDAGEGETATDHGHQSVVADDAVPTAGADQRMLVIRPKWGTTTLLTSGNCWVVTNTQTLTLGLAKLGGRDAQAVCQGQQRQPCVRMEEADSV